MVKKQFDAWNIQKKEIDLVNSTRFYRPRDVWWCFLGLNIGFEQDGKGARYERPVLVLTAFNRHVCLIVPLTSSAKENPYHVYAGLVKGKPSWAIISQIRLVDTKRFVNRCDIIKKTHFTLIQNAIRSMI